MEKILTLLLFGILSLSLAGCQSDPFNQQTSNSGVNKAGAGTLAGAAVGGLVGNQFGHGKGKTLATIGGAILGGVLGNRIGNSLDQSDEIKANQALERNQASSWRNSNNNSDVTVTPTRSYANNTGQTCREYDTTVTIDGRLQRAHGNACRQSDGTWQIVS